MYQRPVKYTAQELRESKIRDLERDIECAERDDCPENPLKAYADRCRRELAELREGGE